MSEQTQLEELFNAYKVNYSNSLMTQQQNENLRIWHERKERNGITLSQIDEWLMKAGLMQKRVLSITDTGMSFSKFKKFSLNEKQFEEFLATLAKDKNLDVNDMKTKLLTAGLPSKQDEDSSPEIIDVY